MSDLLSNVRKNYALLVPVDDREIVSFTVSLTRQMGLKRSAGKRSFVDSVLDALDDFYGDVVQHLREWQPPAPKLQENEAVETVKKVGRSATNTSLKAIGKTPEEKNSIAIVSLDTKTSSIEQHEPTVNSAERTHSHEERLDA